MDKEPWKRRRAENQEKITGEISSKEARKMRARERTDGNLWFWMGMMGIVGWAVALPTVVGVALGTWLDARYPAHFSWTLTFLFVGVVLGCANAWYWVNKERRGD